MTRMTDIELLLWYARRRSEREPDPLQVSLLEVLAENEPVTALYPGNAEPRQERPSRPLNPSKPTTPARSRRIHVVSWRVASAALLMGAVVPCCLTLWSMQVVVGQALVTREPARAHDGPAEPVVPLRAGAGTTGSALVNEAPASAGAPWDPLATSHEPPKGARGEEPERAELLPRSTESPRRSVSTATHPRGETLRTRDGRRGNRHEHDGNTQPKDPAVLALDTASPWDLSDIEFADP
jgi:hypothetical protein